MSSTGLKSDKPVIAVTSGEPAGIGPDICLALADWQFDARIVVLGDRDLLQARARQLKRTIDGLDIRHVPLKKSALAGRLDPANAPYVLDLLDVALTGCQSGEYAAMVTAPVHKGIINDAGIAFTGHTEYLAEKTGSMRVVMMLAGAGLRVALATTHLPLKDVSAALTPDELVTTIRILHADLRVKFGFDQPRILVAGLNPHAGEGGHMGREEIEVIAPVLAALRTEGMDLVGPLPADTLFTKNVLAGSHAQLAMYHDQGWPCSSMPLSTKASMSRSDCRSSVLRSIMAPRSTWPARVGPRRPACMPPSRPPSTWRGASQHDPARSK